MEGSCIGFWKSKANSTFCKVVKQKGEACFCRLCNQVLPKTLRFSLQRQKAPEFGIRRILGLYAGFLFYQQPCAKAKEFGEAEFSDCLPVSALVCVFAFDTGGLGLWLGARLYRCQSAPGPPMPCFVAQSFAFAVFATLICQINIVFPCKDTKAAKSVAFCDSLPVSALVCVFAFDTGGLGLWLGAFETLGLYRCQSVPGPPMPCFVTQSFVLAAFATLVCQRNCVFLCKGTKLQKAALFAIVCRFFCGKELCLWHRALVVAQSFGCDTELWL